jgi:hypothetical protein
LRDCIPIDAAVGMILADGNGRRKQAAGLLLSVRVIVPIGVDTGRMGMEGINGPIICFPW